MQSYDETDYWNKRIKPNSATFDATQHHINYVRENLKGTTEILDFGCGVGRIFDAYKDKHFITGFDISKKYVNEIMLKNNDYEFHFDLIIGKMGKTQFPDNAFDAVVCVSVLLHQRPCNIEMVLKEIVRISKKAIIISYQDENQDYDVINDKKKSNRHCYNYNYIDLCNKLGFKISNYKCVGNQVYFVIKNND